MLLTMCSLSRVLWLISSCVTPKPGSWTLEVSAGPTLQYLAKFHKPRPSCLPLPWEMRRWCILEGSGHP